MLSHQRSTVSLIASLFLRVTAMALPSARCCLNCLTENLSVLEQLVLKSAISCVQTAEGHSTIARVADPWVRTAPCHPCHPPGGRGTPRNAIAMDWGAGMG